MLDNLIFSVNQVLPLCFFVFMGAVLRKNKLFKDDFFPQIDTFVFKISLPCMVFLDVLECDVSQLTDFKLIGFSVIGVVVIVTLLCLIVPKVIKDRGRCGAVIQGAYRSNFAVLGVSLADGLAGDDGVAAMAVVMPFAIVLFNGFAVLILSAFAPEDEKKTTGEAILSAAENVIKNPLIIAAMAALLLIVVRELFSFELPQAAITVTSKLSDTVYALALISLGASMTPESFKDGKIKAAFAASLLKTVVFPLIAVTIAALIGFRGARICVIFVLFGAPAAISSYIMAKNMKSDADLAGQILLLSTIMSMFTIFLGVFIMRTLNLI